MDDFKDCRLKVIEMHVDLSLQQIRPVVFVQSS